MTGWEAWVGPAIVAAFISGLVSLFVVQLNFRQERKIERIRRAEKCVTFKLRFAPKSQAIF